MDALLKYRLIRRLVTIPATVISAVLSVVLAPVSFVGAAVVSAIAGLVSGKRVTAPLRRVMLVTGALVIETLGLLASLLLWFVTGFGLARSTRWSHHLYARLMGTYTSALLRLVARTAVGRTEANLEIRNANVLSPGPVVVAARHTSFFDALIPAALMQHDQNQLVPHHVLAQGLILAPCIDVVGHRFDNQFVRRASSGNERQLSRIHDLGAQLVGDSGAVIFPEGTFRTPERFERTLERILRRDPELGTRLRGLTKTLPPYPNGLYALLQGAPTADLVICVNTGLESFASAKEILRLTATNQPIIVECWRFERSSIPVESQQVFEHWLVDRWFEVDAWVQANAA